MLSESGSRSEDCRKVLRLNSSCISAAKYWNIWTLIVRHGRKSWVCDMVAGCLLSRAFSVVLKNEDHYCLAARQNSEEHFHVG